MKAKTDDYPKHKSDRLSEKSRTRVRSELNTDDHELSADVQVKTRKSKKDAKTAIRRKYDEDDDHWSTKGNSGSLKRKSRKSSNRSTRSIELDHDDDSQDSLPSKDDRRRSKRLANKPRVDYRE